MRIALAASVVLVAAIGLGAQEPPAQPKFDPVAVERGQELLVARCGFCHGTNARGGQQGPDLTRSVLVQEDEGGKQLGEFLKVGRPERNMPKFELTDQELSDLATFLHAEIHLAANRRFYQIRDILTGDARAGEAFFNGAGNCHACHSPTADLKGIGSRYDPATLQERLLMPRVRRRGPSHPGRPDPPPHLEPNAVRATVTLPSGESVTGALVRLTDFDVTVYDRATLQTRTWLRSEGVPRVTLIDPLQAHVDMLRRLTDSEMHDMTAFLATLK